MHYDYSPFRFFLVGSTFGEKKDSVEEDLFRVFSWEGKEEISKPYEYTLTLASTNPFIDPAKILGEKASLLITGLLTKLCPANIASVCFSHKKAPEKESSSGNIL